MFQAHTPSSVVSKKHCKFETTLLTQRERFLNCANLSELADGQVLRAGQNESQRLRFYHKTSFSKYLREALISTSNLHLAMDVEFVNRLHDLQRQHLFRV